MSPRFEWQLFYAMAFGLLVSVAVGPHPACSAAALGLLIAHRLVDKYFHDTLFDQNRRDIEQLRADFGKIKTKQEQAGLKAAFGHPNGQG